jgi:hypothetical protein
MASLWPSLPSRHPIFQPRHGSPEHLYVTPQSQPHPAPYPRSLIAVAWSSFSEISDLTVIILLSFSLSTGSFLLLSHIFFAG